MATLDKQFESPLGNHMLACPAQGQWSSFQLVNEMGDGEPYAGLAYEVIDSEGQSYRGHLDVTGVGKVSNHFAGPIALTFDDEHDRSVEVYARLMGRRSYGLPISELQVRAEQTRYRNKDGSRTDKNPAQACAAAYYQVEVRHLVKHVAHLPPEVERHYPPSQGASRIMGRHGRRGVALLPQQHTVLEVRPLRALRPMLSTRSEFCALNLYQLALMATLSYCPFGQKPDKPPVEKGGLSFPLQPSMGNWFGDALAKFDEIWKVDPGQNSRHYPLYEDVPYSKRLEIAPFDPELYKANDPELDENQETPASIHFLDDSKDKAGATNTQAFITHNDELILISVRGTYELMADGLRDADAFQVPFAEGEGQVHRGFYEAAKKAHAFVTRYLDKFYAGQKLIICGHSLGGAVTLLLSELLRREQDFNYNIQLYTYGAPRAGDASFIKGAASLVHYRIVNHNDPVPSVPGTWMNTKAGVFTSGLALTFVNVPAGLSVFVAGITNLKGEPYGHHGKLFHFMPVEFSRKERSSILWEPGCDTITQHAACEVMLQQKNGLPERPALLSQILSAKNHLMTGSYIPCCWATLRRWQESQASRRSLVTEREFALIDGALVRVTGQAREKASELDRQTLKYRDTHQHTTGALMLEIDKIAMTRARLDTLRYRLVTEKDIYGSVADQPEALAENLLRWNAHPENNEAEQLARVPKSDAEHELLSAIHGHSIGTPYTLDIDSFI
ncbi:lipase family protein [Pseudomonas frederiksbergensis]|uniref:Lipase n=1 Tax=Pseudomonas frederiksbergensis TaxID=104087 RepID=A0A423HEX9_9PSED|nr:lipase family protein [Pseudomonas frederiksbergensis]RON11679.1 lipase [Pseudomonas frederiksbergensis]